MLRNVEQGNFVIVRVWSSRDDKGEIVSAYQAWSRSGNIGHVSLEVFKENVRKYYISFWPVEGVKNHNQTRRGIMIPVSADIEAEGRLPDSRVMIYSVDIQTIENNILETLGINNSNSSPKWCVTGLNCCTSVFTILKKAILEGGMSISEEVQEKLARLEELNQNLQDLSVFRRILSKGQREQEFIEPNLVKDFVEFFCKKENLTYPSLAESKIKFEDNIKRKILDFAKKGDAGLGDLKQYENIYHEIFQACSREKLSTLYRAQQVKGDMQRFLSLGQINLFEGYKITNQDIYEANREEIDLAYQIALQETLPTKIKMLDAVRRGNLGAKELLKLKEASPGVYENNRAEIDGLIKEKMLEYARKGNSVEFNRYKEYFLQIYTINKQEIDLVCNNPKRLSAVVPHVTLHNLPQPAPSKQPSPFRAKQSRP